MKRIWHLKEYAERASDENRPQWMKVTAYFAGTDRVVPEPRSAEGGESDRKTKREKRFTAKSSDCSATLTK